MTLTISKQDWTEWEEARSHLVEYPNPEDAGDVVLPQPTWLAQGYLREIELREGLFVQSDDFQMRDRRFSGRLEYCSHVLDEIKLFV
jgi:hypothetical protein